MKSPTVVLMSMLVTLLASSCASTQPITEPVAVIEAFEEALNDGDLDAAMSFVADDPRFILFSLHTQKAEIRDAYQKWLDLGYHSELRDLRAHGDKVSWEVRLTLGVKVVTDLYEAVVKEGMIESYNVID